MKPGEIIETAMWLAGTETAEQINHFADTIARNFLQGQARREGLDIAPALNLHFKAPTDERAPDVPDHIQGPKVTLLVVEATVVDSIIANDSEPKLFADDLMPDDFAELARITRKRYREAMGPNATLTDAQVKTVINDMGPDAAELALKRGQADISQTVH